MLHESVRGEDERRPKSVVTLAAHAHGGVEMLLGDRNGEVGAFMAENLATIPGTEQTEVRARVDECSATCSGASASRG